MFRMLPNLEELVYCFNTLGTEGMRELARHCPHLRKLTISNSRLNIESTFVEVTNLQLLGKWLTKLRNIDVLLNTRKLKDGLLRTIRNKLKGMLPKANLKLHCKY
jgi:Ran GTPase-activating protein (RanGAP) involved in mRNA processing and transport